MDTVEFMNMLCWFDCNVEFGNLDGEFYIYVKINDNINQEDLDDIIKFIKEHSDADDIRIDITGSITVSR